MMAATRVNEATTSAGGLSSGCRANSLDRETIGTALNAVSLPSADFNSLLALSVGISARF
jgi:hypothetical protein